MPIIYLYGDPGSSKSSIINTALEPILIDFDRGADRTILRKVVLQPDDWEEVKTLEKQGEFLKYRTVGVDTAKGALDDFIQPWIINQDPKYNTLKWQRQLYGEMGKEFKRFINNRRAQNCAVIVIAHARKEEDGKIVPDVTGGSAAFLLRLADQVGYISVKKGKRVIQFEPTEETYGKNCANLPLVEVPHKDSEEFKTFGAMLVTAVHNALNSMSIEQQEAIEKAEEYNNQIDVCDKPEDLTAILKDVNQLPDFLKLPLRKTIGEKAKEKNWGSDREKGFVAAPATKEPVQGEPAAEEAPKKQTKFQKTYADPQSLAAVIEKATKADHIADILFNSADMLEAHPELKAKIDTKITQINAAKEQVPG